MVRKITALTSACSSKRRWCLLQKNRYAVGDVMQFDTRNNDLTKNEDQAKREQNPQRKRGFVKLFNCWRFNCSRRTHHTFIDVTLSNNRRFYLSMRNPLAVKRWQKKLLKKYSREERVSRTFQLLPKLLKNDKRERFFLFRLTYESNI